MKILMLGGTSFVGRHITECAIRKGHEVVLFNRGKSNPSVFPELQHIKGDRRKDAHKLDGMKWDAVIDSSAYTVSDLHPVLGNLETDHYTFISTISVYDDFTKGPVKESSSVHDLKPETDEVDAETYGPLKAQCENALKEKLGEKLLIIRPGIVIGPYDPTDRFTYWAEKLDQEERVLIPGEKGRRVQWIDASDLAEFVISSVEKSLTGVFNVVADPLSMEDFVQEVKTEKAETVWADDPFLVQEGLMAFEVPFWIPVTPEYPEGFILADNQLAKKAGLSLTEVSKSAEVVRSWRRQSGKHDLKAGISRQKEKELLDKLMR